MRKEAIPPHLLEETLANLPSLPGVYLFRDLKDRVLYVGKARNLRQRVRSYFQVGGDQRVALPFLRSKVARIETIVVPDEYEALLLEETLIKEHRPRYNVRLRDDKSFLYLRLRTDHEFPYLELVRRPREQGFPTFGPYASAVAARQMLKVLREFFPLRTCSNYKFAHRSRPCLDHALGRCPAPCVGLISKEAYEVYVQGAQAFLQGEREGVKKKLREEMERASEKLRFEDAALLRDRLRALEESEEQPLVVRFAQDSSDYWGIAEGEESFAFVVLKVVGGKVVHLDPFPGLHRPGELPLDQLLLQYYRSPSTLPALVHLPLRFQDALNRSVLERILSERRGKRVELHFPERGRERELLEMAERNARELLKESRAYDDLKGGEELVRLFHLRKVPEIMECYDVSHIMGEEPVGVQITFVRGFEDLSRRRYYRLEALPRGETPAHAEAGSGDPQWMAEVLRRRLQRGLQEGDLPDLIVLDGGKSQLMAVVRLYRELEMEWERVPVVALAKARPSWEQPSWAHEERVYLPGRKNPVILKRGSDAYKLLVHLRNTTHRAAVGFHRRRYRSALLLGLEQIPGMGAKRRQRILEAFPNLQLLVQTPTQEAARATGIPLAVMERVKEWLTRAVKETPQVPLPQPANPLPFPSPSP